MIVPGELDKALVSPGTLPRVLYQNKSLRVAQVSVTAWFGFHLHVLSLIIPELCCPPTDSSKRPAGPAASLVLHHSYFSFVGPELLSRGGKGVQL